MFSGRESTLVTVRCRKYRAQALLDSGQPSAQAARLDVVLACRPCFVSEIHGGERTEAISSREKLNIGPGRGQTRTGSPRFGAADAKAPHADPRPRIRFSISTVHGYIEDQRALLRLRISRPGRSGTRLIARGDQYRHRENRPAHQRRDSQSKPRLGAPNVTVEEWEAPHSSLWRSHQVARSKEQNLLSTENHTVKVEPPPVVVPESEEQRARAREALKTWTKFCVDPKDFQSRDLS